MNNRLLVPQKLPLLLDYAPGAAAAYSLRSLSNSYVGPVVTVRRSTDSAEADFTSTEVSDGTLAAWCGGGDGFVKTWHDQSLNGRDATQTTAGYQPQLVSGGVVIQEGGKPAISFANSVNACLKAAFAVSQPNAVIGVLKFTSLTGTYLYDGFGSALRQASYVTSGIAYLYAGTSGSTGHVVNTTSQSLYFAVFDGASSSLSINGVTRTCDAGTSATDGVTIGARYSQSQGTDGTFSELIIYPTDMTALRTRIEGNMNRHFGVF